MRAAAELLRGAAVCVDRTLFPPLDEDEFYVCDVIGARLVGPSGDVGFVENFVSYPSAEVLVVRLQNGVGNGQVELPLVEDFVVRVEAGAGREVLTAEGVAWVARALGGDAGRTN